MSFGVKHVWNKYMNLDNNKVLITVISPKNVNFFPVVYWVYTWLYFIFPVKILALGLCFDDPMSKASVIFVSSLSPEYSPSKAFDSSILFLAQSVVSSASCVIFSCLISSKLTSIPLMFSADLIFIASISTTTINNKLEIGQPCFIDLVGYNVSVQFYFNVGTMII